MINKIGIQNFRVFKDLQEFELKPFTILTGANDCGKSTIQKVLFLLKASYLDDVKNASFEKLIFNTNTIQKIGLFENNLSYKHESDEMIFTFTLSTKFWGEVDINLVYKKSLFNQSGILNFIEIEKNKKKIFGFSNRQMTSEEKKELDLLATTFDIDELNENYQDRIEENPKDRQKEHKDWWEHVYGWAPRIELTDEIINKFHELFLADKVNFLQCKSIFNISNKRTLTKSEEEIKTKLEEIGFLFDDKRAWDEKERDYANPYSEILPVWDGQKNRVCRVDDVSRVFSPFYYDDSPEVFIPTLLSYVVLGTPGFFEGKMVEQKALIIRGLLYGQNINNKEDFLKEYKKFELSIIKESLLLPDYNEVYHEGQIEPEIEMLHNWEFDKFFNTNDFLIDVIYLDKSNKIFSIITNEEYYNLNFQSENIDYNALHQKQRNWEEDWEFKALHTFDRKIPENDLEDIKNMESIVARIRNIPRNLIAELNTQLKDLMLSCSIAFENINTKRYYLYNQAEPEDKLFLDFANSYDEGSLSDQYKFCNHWLKEFDIADELKVKPVVLDNKAIGVSFWISKEGGDYPLDDSGVGVKHLIQLIIRIAVLPQKSLLLIEEPESNLHPAYQSKIAELLADAHQKFQIKFIIETHSEYLIRKFQYLVASPEHDVKAEDISISYLYHPDKVPEGKKQVEKLIIEEDGGLDGEFGKGFFDEASNWKRELMRLKHAQKN